jgi:hypothetical protein
MGSSSLVIYGIHDAATLEAIACRHALSLVEDLTLKNFLVASDSKQIVKNIEKGSQGSYGNIIRETNSRSQLFNCIFFSFEGRSANNDADGLAKFSHSLDQGRHVWFVQPLM